MDSSSWEVEVHLNVSRVGFCNASLVLNQKSRVGFSSHSRRIFLLEPLNGTAKTTFLTTSFISERSILILCSGSRIFLPLSNEIVLRPIMTGSIQEPRSLNWECGIVSMYLVAEVRYSSVKSRYSLYSGLNSSILV